MPYMRININETQILGSGCTIYSYHSFGLHNHLAEAGYHLFVLLFWLNIWCEFRFQKSTNIMQSVWTLKEFNKRDGAFFVTRGRRKKILIQIVWPLTTVCCIYFFIGVFWILIFIWSKIVLIVITRLILHVNKCIHIMLARVFYIWILDIYLFIYV